MTMINLYPVIAETLHVSVGKAFKLKPKHGGAYPAQYRFSADDLEYRPSQCCHWSSISNQPMQMRIFLALLRGGVEVIKDEQKSYPKNRPNAGRWGWRRI